MSIKMNHLQSCVLSVTLAAMGAGTASAKPPPARNIYVFGDANSSVGNDAWAYSPNSCALLAQCSGAFSGWEYRFSNGPTWVERLGYQIGLAPDLATLQAPYGGYTQRNKGYSFAHQRSVLGNIGESASDTGGVGVNYARLNASKQIDFFTQNVASGAIKTRANDLHTFWFTPEVFNPFDNAETRTSAATASLDRLRGAPHRRSSILVLGSMLPSQFGSFGLNDTDSLNTQRNLAANALNAALSSYAQSTRNTNRAQAKFVDVAALIGDIQNRPSAYNIRVAKRSITTVSTQVAPGIFIPIPTAQPGNCLAAGYTASNCPNDYLFYSDKNLSSRGHDILAYYVASTLGGVYAWDQYRAVGSGGGAQPIALASAGTNAIGSASLTNNVLGLNVSVNHAGVRSFAFGLTDNQEGFAAYRNRIGSLQIFGTTAQIAPNLSGGAATFTERSVYKDLNAGTRSYGGSGHATLTIGPHTDLNLIGASQNRTLNTNRPVLFDYVGGVATAQTKVRLDTVQASLSRMFDVKGAKVGPVVGVAHISERWGAVKETGVPLWLAANSDVRWSTSHAVNLGLAASWSGSDRHGGRWNVGAQLGRIKTDDWAPVALVAPSVTLAEALEQEKGAASYATVSVGRDASIGWGFGLEAGFAQTEAANVSALRTRATFRF